MNEKAQAELLMDWIFCKVIENAPEDVQKTCPVVTFLREVHYSMKDKTHEQIESELGVFFGDGKYPCEKCQ